MKKPLIIMLILALIYLLFSCGPSKEEMERREAEQAVKKARIDSIKAAASRGIDLAISKVNEASKHSKWSSIDTGLPTGTILTMDAGEDAGNNYVTIRKPDGYNTVVRDIDEDLFLSLRGGDIIE